MSFRSLPGAGPDRSAAIAVPVQDQDRGVVLEAAVAGIEDRAGQGPDDFSRVQRPSVVNDGGQVGGRGTALLHAVGEKDQAVPGTQLQFLDAVGGGCRHTERQVDGELDLFDGAVTQPQRPGMAGVDQFAQAGFEVDAQQLSGGQPAAVAQQGLVGVVGLLEGVTATAARRRSAPTNKVASSAEFVSWPIASVMDRCRVSRSRL